jgi:hypothetical protein
MPAEAPSPVSRSSWSSVDRDQAVACARTGSSRGAGPGGYSSTSVSAGRHLFAGWPRFAGAVHVEGQTAQPQEYEPRYAQRTTCGSCHQRVCASPAGLTSMTLVARSPTRIPSGGAGDFPPAHNSQAATRSSRWTLIPPPDGTGSGISAAAPRASGHHSVRFRCDRSVISGGILCRTAAEDARRDRGRDLQPVGAELEPPTASACSTREETSAFVDPRSGCSTPAFTTNIVKHPQKCACAFAQVLAWRPRTAECRSWAIPQVSRGGAVGDHPYESNSGLTSAVLESSSDGFSFAVAGEPVPSEP